MSAVYDPNVVRGSATFPPPGPGVVPLAGFADGEFATPEYNQGDAVTHTAVDGLSVHTKARDTAGGSVRVAPPPIPRTAQPARSPHAAKVASSRQAMIDAATVPGRQRPVPAG